MTKIDYSLFEGEHYMGRPADFTDLIISRRVNLVHKISGFCDTHKTLAEIGCGNGSTMILLAPYFRQLDGYELFAGHQNVFEQLRKAYQINNCSFTAIDIENQVPDQRYDRLISFEVIEHLRDDNHVRNFRKLLKDDGLAAFTVPNKWWIFETHGAKLPLLPWNRVPFFSWLPTPIHERFANARIYTAQRFKKLLERNGFEVLSIEYVMAPMDVLPDGWLKNIIRKWFFRQDTTRYPFKAVSLFVVAKPV